MKWIDIINQELRKVYMRDLSEYLRIMRNKNDVYPDKKDTFAAFGYFEPEDLKVVILGQDPYNKPGQAHGLAFSTKEKNRPYSLQVIWKEINDSFSEMYTALDNHKINYLESWANQGVLLLNRVLSVNKESSKSHYNKGWERFTDRIINEILLLDKLVIWCLWGSEAKKALIGKKSRYNNHVFLFADHPAATRYSGKFLGCNHFLIINQILAANNDMPINWSLYPDYAKNYEKANYCPMFNDLEAYEVWKSTPEGRELIFIDNKRLKFKNEEEEINA